MKGRTPILSAAALLVIIALGVGGYLLGASRAADSSEAEKARTEARQEALEAAQKLALSESRARGLAAGRRRGEREGRDDGSAAGEADAAEELAAAEPTEPAPGTPGSTVCVTGQDYVPGVGCVPPVAPGQTEAPVNCPPGQVPVGTTGACAPR